MLGVSQIDRTSLAAGTVIVAVLGLPLLAFVAKFGKLGLKVSDNLWVHPVIDRKRSAFSWIRDKTFRG